MTICDQFGNNKNPLNQYPIFESSDIEEAHDLIAKNFGPHSLSIMSCRQKMSTQYNGIFFSNGALLFNTYGADVQINPESNKYFFTQTTLAGNTEISLGKQICQTQSGSTVVVSPSTNYQMKLQQGSKRLIIMLEREALEQQLCRLINQPIKQPLMFDLGMNEHHSNQLWSRSLLYLCDQFAHSKNLSNCNAYLKHSCDMLMALLLEVQPHNYSNAFNQHSSDHCPRHVKRAIAYIEENIERPISLSELACAVGVTARTLQNGFMRYTESTPSEYIRSEKIRAIHEALLKAPVDQQVSEILLQYGISSFGHFSRLYKQRYGCTPCQTLKKARGEV